MKYLKSGYTGERGTDLYVLLLNDLHVGSEAADLDLLDRAIKFALDNKENTRILLNGDLIEGVTKLSKGDIFSQRMTPKEQADYVVEKLMPVKDLIDGVTEGNHDFRIMKETSIDIVEMICKYLGIEDKYLGIRGIVGFNVGGNMYSIDMHHGTGGGSTLAAVENNMKKIWKSDSDIMYCGHWHKELAKPIKRFSIDHKAGKVEEVKRWLICGNTIVNTADYAKRGAFEEGFPSQAVVKLGGEERSIEVDWIR